MCFTPKGSSFDTLVLNGIARKSMVPVLSVKKVNDHIGVAQLYPNPAADVVNIEFDKEAGNIQISIIDLTGKIVSSQREPRTRRVQIDMHSLQTGVYILAIQDDKGSTAQYKIIKN